MIALISTDGNTGLNDFLAVADHLLITEYLTNTDRYFAARGVIPSPDTTPTEENMLNAKVLLLEKLLGGFSFEDASDRAHAIALVLQPVARPFIEGPTPLYVISGARASGKTSLLRAAVLPYQEAEVVGIAGVSSERE